MYRLGRYGGPPWQRLTQWFDAGDFRTRYLLRIAAGFLCLALLGTVLVLLPAGRAYAAECDGTRSSAPLRVSS